MDDQQRMFPEGLPKSQFDTLSRLANDPSHGHVHELLPKVEEHLHKIRDARGVSAIVNLRLAEAIGSVIRQLVQDWDGVPKRSRAWIKAAILYFITVQLQRKWHTQEPQVNRDFEALRA